MAWRRPGDKTLSEPMMVRLPTHICVTRPQWVNTLRPGQNGRHFPYDVFKCVFLNENMWISLKCVPNGPVNNTPELVQITAWRRPGDKPLSEPMLVDSTTHICAQHLWVKSVNVFAIGFIQSVGESVGFITAVSWVMPSRSTCTMGFFINLDFHPLISRQSFQTNFWGLSTLSLISRTMYIQRLSRWSLYASPT